MKRWFLAGLIAGLIAATVGIASASSLWRVNGVLCKPGGGGVACVPSNGEGYGVGITTGFVMVMNLDTGRRVFVRVQP